ncbi:Subtilisin J [Myxococcus hansupus]|uniref:Subtilisin J n=1 Tax=Pseudomyxococcus hansupus TaxID=1297742 RepID=A0A0H4X9Y9_9BACT|nr:S8 family serine peptidase [Myxococcus hansupus]AKQ70415.1 Subtilisin J [Myxococcus hansupus]
MKRWGLMGLLALVACGPDDASDKGAQSRVCPNVIAGALSEPVSTRQVGAPLQMEEDGRQRVIIRYRNMGVRAQGRVEQVGGQVTATFRTTPAVAARMSLQEQRALLAEDPLVESIELDQTWHALAAATAPAPTLLTALTRGANPNELTAGLRKVQANEVWDLDGDGLPDPGRPTGAGVRVCVIDSGLDLEHPELMDAVVAGRDLLDDDDTPSDFSGSHGWGTGHGTHVAGIIAARPGHGGQGTPALQPTGLMGVAPGAELVIARVLDLYGSTHMSFVLAAVEYCAEQGAKVVSLSLGGGVATKTTLEVFEAARAQGMLVVAASGNYAVQAVDYPASDPNVLAVGALDAYDRRANFSSGGRGLALMAPGVDVLSTFPRGQGAFSTVDVQGTQPTSRSLLYGPIENRWGKLVDCGFGDSLDSCKGSTCSGFIAYVRHGKVPTDFAMVNVMKQGARAVIFGNARPEGGVDILSMPRRGQWVPAVTITQAGGTVLNRMLGELARVSMVRADYTYMSGTSMATPYVSGVAALLFSAYPAATPDQVKHALLSSAKDLGPAGYDEDYGHGLVQARLALETLAAMP